MIETYKSQAESYRALTDAMTSSMEALERTLKSQEETNRALKESLTHTGTSSRARARRRNGTCNSPRTSSIT